MAQGPATYGRGKNRAMPTLIALGEIYAEPLSTPARLTCAFLITARGSTRFGLGRIRERVSPGKKSLAADGFEDNAHGPGTTH